MLEFILGSGTSKKTEAVYEDIEKRLDKKLSSWILVPEQFSLFTEKEIISKFGLPAQAYVKVLSFSRLCNLILQHTGPLRMKYIDGAGKQIIAAQTMEKVQGNLKILGRNLRQKGFNQVFLDTVSECKRYGVTPQLIRFAAENTTQETLGKKLDDIAFMFETYNALLEKESADAEDNLTMVCSKIQNCDFLKGKLYIQHFRSFTPVEHKAIGQLLHKVDICISLDYSEDGKFSGLFNPVNGTINRLKEIAQAEDIEVCTPKILPDCNGNTALEYVKDRYFDSRAKTIENDGTVVFYEAQNLYREAEAAADLVIKLCRTENMKFSDIIILARDTQVYNRIMPAIFEKRGIRIFLDTGRSITSKPLLRMLGGILEILANGYSYERMMAIARSGLSKATMSQADHLENYILATAPNHAVWNSERWEYCPQNSGFDMEIINTARDLIIDDLKFIQNKISGRKTGGEICSAILEWMKESDISQRVTAAAEKCMADNMPELADEYVQVWNSVGSLLSQFGAIMKDTTLSYRRFLDIFNDACSGIEIGMTPQTLDCVVFSQIDRFRSSNSKAVIVLGLNNGSFPKAYMSEGFLSDMERREMEKLGVELAPCMDSKRREEQLLIYTTLTASTNKLFLFRPICEMDNKPNQKSEILDRISELVSGIETINPDTSSDPVGLTEGSSAAFDVLAAALAEYASADNLPRHLKELYHWFKNNPQYKDRLEKLQRSIQSPMPQKLSEEMAEKLYGFPLMLSASQLETYNSCAYKYFLNYGLMLKERETAGVEPRGMGSVQHAALFEYFTYLKETNADFNAITQEECFRQVSDAVEKNAIESSQLLYESSSYYKYIVMRMKGIASRTAWEVVKFYRSGEFKPFGYEIVIGTKGQIPAISVKARDGKEIAKIKGFIDRADSAEIDGTKYISVIDYKSSAKDLDITLAQDGIVLQPLLYANAIRESIPNSKVAAMVYMQMNDPILTADDVRRGGGIEKTLNKQMTPKGWLSDNPAVVDAYTKYNDSSTGSFLPSGSSSKVTEELMEGLLKESNRRIQEAAEGIITGNIGIKPYKSTLHDACAYCEYGGICKIEG